MTCIVGFVDRYKNEIWMGGDSAGVAGLNVVLRKDTKVFKKQNMLFGYTSSFRMGQLLRFKLDIPKIEKNKDVYEYMCTDFIDSVRKRFKDGGYSLIKDNREEGGFFLVGYKGNLYQIEGDFQVGECADDFDSVGCGSSYALGALYITRKNKNPRDRILQALETAEYFSTGVKRPFVIEKLG